MSLSQGVGIAALTNVDASEADDVTVSAAAMRHLTRSIAISGSSGVDDIDTIDGRNRRQRANILTPGGDDVIGDVHLGRN